MVQVSWNSADWRKRTYLKRRYKYKHDMLYEHPACVDDIHDQNGCASWVGHRMQSKLCDEANLRKNGQSSMRSVSYINYSKKQFADITLLEHHFVMFYTQHLWSSTQHRNLLTIGFLVFWWQHGKTSLTLNANFPSQQSWLPGLGKYIFRAKLAISLAWPALQWKTFWSLTYENMPTFKGYSDGFP